MTDLADPANLPSPPIEEFDLRVFAEVELDQRLLYHPAIVDLSDAAFRAAISLIFNAWREVPCGSLPAVEAALCKCAGFGRDLAAWREVREETLKGWEYCSDGRLWFRPMLPSVERAAARRKSTRSTDKMRKQRSRMREALRSIGVRAPDKDLEPHLDAVHTELEQRGGARLRGRDRSAMLTQIASGLGLLPDRAIHDATLAIGMRAGAHNTS